MLGWSTIVSAALAGSTGSEVFQPRPIAGHPVFELRVGLDDRLQTRHPTLCAEGAPVQWLAIELCGTGQGILHHSDEPDMAHFRAFGRALHGTFGRSGLDLRVGGGFTEIQRGADAPGFRFGEAREAAPVEAAGPEAALSLKGRHWVDRGGRSYVTGDLSAGTAWIPAAGAVMGRGGPLVPFTQLTVGYGF